MNCELCDLSQNEKDGFIITVCKTCGVPLIVAHNHREEFTPEEKELIQDMFPEYRIRWEQRKIKDHAHCHLLGIIY